MSTISQNLLPFSPSTIVIFNDNYKIIEKIYTQELASTEILLVEDTNGVKWAAKRILKKKLKSELFHELIRNEFALHFSLSKLCNNIIKVPDYFEDEVSYLMLMEYSSQPNYFEELLENVNIIINLALQSYFK